MSSTNTTDPAGFDAMGRRVPEYRKAAALNHLRDMNPNLDTEAEMTLVGKVATAIENDDPFSALDTAQDHLDLTGAYRLLATLCTAER